MRPTGSNAVNSMASSFFPVRRSIMGVCITPGTAFTRIPCLAYSMQLFLLIRLRHAWRRHMQAVLKTNKSSYRRAVDDGTFTLFKHFRISCCMQSQILSGL
jgi:hypothetical protein